MYIFLVFTFASCRVVGGASVLYRWNGGFVLEIYICQKLHSCEFSFCFQDEEGAMCCYLRGVGLSMYAVYFCGLFPSLLCGL
jgi:hypothetical protein